MPQRRWPALLALVILLSPCAVSAVTLSPFIDDSLAKIKQQYEGRPFLLALWSLECPACFRELQHFAEVKQQYPDLPLVLVAADSWQDGPEVMAALAEMGLDGTSAWLFMGAAQSLRHAIDPNWRGELPRSYLFNRMHQPIVKSGLLSKQEIAAWWQLKRSLSH